MINQVKGKYFIVGLLMVLLTQMAAVQGQIQINSPYTRYGLGNLVENGMDPRITAMGGLYYGLRANNLINTANPASYAAFDSVSFIFDAGIFGIVTNLQTDRMSDQGELYFPQPPDVRPPGDTLVEDQPGNPPLQLCRL
jgi:hypothetical protein